uniref:Uncharacterized protein n=1 Tax=Chromera velia CCMP2878 TaxID=1169474 RepID=A0A0G4H913_9ALVE|eukprot:Cvel_5925.t1-p1 / transcript=Cvel_5925.t1 / gene=Cvel_5925 / organism=Chromera_velia_CCMP2878 / gene_product=hypothetical protein / transcript_product=hypothetical protein / location=Cvel_scaffold283:72394-73043(+) / protein_length=151 / sequence_SO=supercontig / SO=protein_coding / is_pseudo=false
MGGLCCAPTEKDATAIAVYGMNCCSTKAKMACDEARTNKGWGKDTEVRAVFEKTWMKEACGIIDKECQKECKCLGGGTPHQKHCQTTLEQDGWSDRANGFLEPKGFRVRPKTYTTYNQYGAPTYHFQLIIYSVHEPLLEEREGAAVIPSPN